MIFSCKLAYVEPLCTNSYVLSRFCPRIPKSAPLRVYTLRLLVCLDGAISTQILLGSHKTHHKVQFTRWKHSAKSDILLDISHSHQLVPQYLNTSYTPRHRVRIRLIFFLVRLGPPSKIYGNEVLTE